jgi:Xaa-Pro aminopeptidase
VLFILEPSEVMQTWEGHKYSRKEATEISGITRVRWTTQFDIIRVGTNETYFFSIKEHHSVNLSRASHMGLEY